MEEYDIEFIWEDRKRIFFGLPWSFTRYYLTDEKLLIDTGFFNRTEDEVRLYRILDITLKRSFWERLFGLGTIHCCTADKSMGEFDIQHVKKPKLVKNMRSEMVEEERRARRVGMREFVGGDEADAEGDGEHDFEL